MKTCTKCRTEYDLHYFSKKKDTKDGLTLWCKGCIRQQSREYYNKNKAELRRKNKEYVAAHKAEQHAYKNKSTRDGFTRNRNRPIIDT